AHPRIEVEPTCRVTDAMGIEGYNRYPGALATDERAGLDIENRAGHGSRIPRLDPGAEANDLAERLELPTFAVEKIHPEFVDFDAAALLDKIERYEREHDAQISLIYRLRDPAESIKSMLAYKRRDPRWYDWLKPDAVPAFFERSYRTLADLAELRPGVVSLYEQHRLDAPKELARLYAALWPKAPKKDLVTIARAAEGEVDRARGQRASTNPFFRSAPAAPKDSTSKASSKQAAPDVSADELLARHAETLRVLSGLHDRLTDSST
ncbi:MAG: hypothetical protein AAGK04_14820, partial [Planctomycetota bacterium]